jgi:hypothetical protein
LFKLPIKAASFHGASRCLGRELERRKGRRTFKKEKKRRKQKKIRKGKSIMEKKGKRRSTYLIFELQELFVLALRILVSLVKL